MTPHEQKGGGLEHATTEPPSEAHPVEQAPLPAWPEYLVRLLDDGIPVPGTRGVGLDALLGFFFPGAGDVVGGVGSLALFGLALRERVPPTVLGRMVWNVALDVLAGTLPVLGDLFDLAWRANRRNLELIRKHRSPGRPWTLGDILVWPLALGIAVVSISLPILLFLAIGTTAVGWLFRR